VRTSKEIVTKQKDAIVGKFAADKKVRHCKAARLVSSSLTWQRSTARTAKLQSTARAVLLAPKHSIACRPPAAAVNALLPPSTASHMPAPPAHPLLLPPPVQDAGLAALAKLETSLDEFQALIEAKDKQEVPIKQREALSYVGGVEEAMVSGFPFEVPKEYADRPLLLVGGHTLRGRIMNS
jgi:hypothetical protein